MSKILYYSIYKVINFGNIGQNIFEKIIEFGADGRLTEKERDELIALYNAEKEKQNGSRED